MIDLGNIETSLFDLTQIPRFGIEAAHPEGKLSQYLVGRLSNYGYEAELQKFLYNDQPVANVLARKRGFRVTKKLRTPRRYHVVCTHTDTAIDDICAIDNTSGTAALLEMARVLSPYEPEYESSLYRFLMRMNFNRRAILFAFTCLEEDGQVGAEHLSRELRNTIATCINLDSVGDERLYTWTIKANMKEGSVYRILSECGYPILFRDLAYRDSDATAFALQRIRTIYIGGTDQTESYHTKYDTVDKVNLWNIRRAILIALRCIDAFSTF